jgi:hypothetical protein
MFKRLILIGLTILMLGSIVMASDLVMLEPKKVSADRGPVVLGLNEMDDIFYLRRYTSDQEFYLPSGSQGDTMLVVFQPLAPCSIYFAQHQWHSAGNYQAFIWEYNEACMNQDDPDSIGYDVGRSPERSMSPESPVGATLFGPYATTAEGTSDWEDMFVGDDIPDGGIWIEDGSMFCVGWVKTQNDGFPQPMADDASARGFQYTWFGGPWMIEEDYLWGSYLSDPNVELMMRVGVSYPLGGQYIFGFMNQLPNTVNAAKVCDITCEILEDDSWIIDTAVLNVSINGGTATEFTMTDDDDDTIFEAEFDLGTMGAATNDVVAYWVVATDDEGEVYSNFDRHLSFDIVALNNPDAGILIVDTGLSGGNDRTPVLMNYLWDNNINFEYWNVADNKGIDEYTVDLDWNAVLVLGWGTTAIPTSDAANAFSGYLDGGGNIMLSDMDYFLANNEAAEPIFEAGDFAYDYFGIASALNDPEVTDTTFYGVAEDPISGDFEDDPLITYAEHSGDWADIVIGIPGTVAIFTGENTDSVFAISYDRGNGKSLFLGFDVVSACYVWYYDEYGDPVLRGTEQFGIVMDNVMAYFGVTSETTHHFNSVDPTGLAYALIIDSATIVEVDLVVGDEVGVFDSDLCVGSAEVTGDWPLVMTAWEGDPSNGLAGFTAGNTMLFKIWSSSDESELETIPTYTVGDGTFGSGTNSQLSLMAFRDSNPPLMFDLLSPVDESVCFTGDTTLVWQKTTDIDPDDIIEYELNIATDETFSSDLQTFTVTDTTYSIENLTTDTYWWKVKAQDLNSAGTWSNQIWSFNVQTSSADEDLDDSIPTEFAIISAYPNPFNPTLTVVIGLPMTSNLKVSVHNIMGQSVSTLSNGGQYSAGYHNFVFDGGGMASGVYFVHAIVPGKLNQVQKIVLMK